MLESAIAELVARLGLNEEQAAAIRALVFRAAALPPSSMMTLVQDVDDTGTELHDNLPGPEIAGSYEDLGVIATGGMGEVRRIRDPDLGRVVALKVIKPELAQRPQVLRRFVAEARTSAQLQHPSIVPVHEIGRLDDGRYYFTMKEVKGRTLTEVARELHHASESGAWHPSAGGWTLRRLLDAFHQACLAVAYAHSRGVIHRDLKPENIMLGAFGEVHVMDWGLAKVVPTDTSDPVDPGPPVETRPGALSGTPVYMSPEQAWGDQLTPASDVYSLGATLYHLLAGRPPFQGTPDEVIAAVREGHTPELVRVIDGEIFTASREFTRDELSQIIDPNGAPPIPSALAQICRKAMAREPAERYETAKGLAQAMGHWLDGSERRHRARAEVKRAQALLPLAVAQRLEAARLRLDAKSALAQLPSWSPDDQKEAHWHDQDKAAELDREADLHEIDVLGILRGALNLAPNLAEAHAALAERHLARHKDAESRRDRQAAQAAEVLLTAHATALPGDHPARASHLAYLSGRGSLSLATEPAGAEISLSRYMSTNRRLFPIFQSELPPTPVVEYSTARGSYAATIRAEGHATVTLPIRIRRGEHHTQTPPDSESPEAVLLPPAGSLAPTESYIPAGWFLAGGFGNIEERELWVSGFTMQRNPVTVREYIAFLDDLASTGRSDEAAERAPRDNGTTSSRYVSLGDDGRYSITANPDGESLDPEWPIVLITWADAQAYAAWLSKLTRLPWRLPSEWEWEKAARGVDGRAFPWGEFADHTWFNNAGARRGRPSLVRVSDYPEDESIYGIRGLAGNVHDFCLDEEGAALPADGTALIVEPAQPGTSETSRAVRGGAWTLPLERGQCASRRSAPEIGRYNTVGFRLVRSFPA